MKNTILRSILLLCTASRMALGGEPAASASVAAAIPAPQPAPARPDATLLVGRQAAEVQSQLGKPMGKLLTSAGPLWFYSDWKVQFDQRETVLSVEKDAPVRTVNLDPATAARLDALAKAERQRAAEADAFRIQANAAAAAAASGERIRIVSNRGERVDLDSLLVAGKVTIVDFYADWCGPCRQIAPVLEKLAHDNPDVAVVKIDIVKWGTPVAAQFGLNAIPNLRVFDRKKKPVGQPTSSLGEIINHVKAAIGS